MARGSRANEAAGRAAGRPEGEPPRPSVPDHELIRFIARGSFGSVWLAKNIMGTFRAVKVVFRADFETDREFERELDGIQKFEPVSRTHDDLIDILHVGRNDQAGYFYYVMEVGDDQESGQQIQPETYEAKTLEKEISRRGRLPFGECLQVGLSVADGLRHLNEHGLIHRDIKPSNIIFINGIPKIADIGLVTEVGQSHSFVGTPGYMAPEGPWTVQADIYSLGKVLYEVSFGKDRQAFPALPTQWAALEEREKLLELNEVITKACDGDTRRRYQSAAEMHADLVLLQAGQSVKRLRTLERRLALARRIALVAGLALLAVGATLHQARQAEREARKRQAASYVTVGAQAMSQGDLIGSLPWFTEALSLETGDPDRERTHRTRIGSVLRQCPRIVQMWFHSSPVLAVDVSPDGNRVVAGDKNGDVTIWDIERGTFQITLAGHNRAVCSVAYSLDGRWIASGSWDNTARVWDATTYQPHLVLPHPDDVTSIQFSPDHSLILTSSDDHQARLFDAGSGQLAAGPFEHHRLNHAAFGPDGSFFGTASWDERNVLLWRSRSPGDGEPRTSRFWPTNRPPVAFRHGNWINKVAISPDGLRLGTASFDKTAGIWDLSSGGRIHKLKHPQFVRGIRFSPDGRHVITVCDDLTARLWDTRTGEEAGPPLKHSSYLYDAVFGPDGRHVVTATVQGVISVWDLSPNSWVPTPTEAHFSPDGNRSVSLQAHEVTVANITGSGRIGTFSLSEFVPADVKLNPTGTRILTLSSPVTDADDPYRWAQLLRWDAAGVQRVALPYRCDDSFTNAVLNAEGTELISFRGSIAQWHDAATGRANGPPMVHDEEVKAVAWGASARYVLTRTSQSAHLWDAVAGRRRELEIQANHVSYGGFSPDGRYLVTCYADNQLQPYYAQIFVTSTGRRFNQALNHGDGVIHMAFSRDGQQLVTSSEFKTAQIWKTKTGRLERVLTHDDQVLASAFSADQRWVVTVCTDGSARVWELETGEPVTPRIKSGWGVMIDTDVQFLGGQQGILMNRWKTRRRVICSLPADTNAVKALASMASVLSGHRSGRTGGAEPLELRELREAWNDLPDGLLIPDNSPAARVRWHEPQAAANAFDGDWFAVVFHLGALVALQPHDPLLKSRHEEARGKWDRLKAELQTPPPHAPQVP